MARKDKKQRHEAKRKAKRLAARRRESISPVKRLADATGETEFWMSTDFEFNGQTQIFAYKRGAGLSGVACFLIDRGVVGLKDAWMRMDVDRDDLDGMLEGSRARGVRMQRVGRAEVQRLIAGSVRWAHENGMRLPKDWIRSASLIGGVGDWASADVSEFVREFAGHPEDLRQRLIAEPFDTYIRRNDIAFIFNDAAPYLDQGTGEYVDQSLLGFDDDEDDNEPGVDDDDLDDEEFQSIVDALPEEELNALVDSFVPAAAALAVETANWLANKSDKSEHDAAPSPQLFEAWRSILLASMASKWACPTLLKDLSDRIEPAVFSDYHRAVGQALAHLKTDPQMMRKAAVKHGFTGETQENSGSGSMRIARD